MAMEDHAQGALQEIFTIGHSNHTIEKFLGLLAQHSIRIVVDSRSHPYSKFVPHFDRETLGSYLESRGVRYLYMGDERSEEHTSELQSLRHLVCRLLLEKK